MENKQITNPINWQPIIELAIAAAMVIGTVVPLYVHTDGKLHSALTTIQNDMKDFHGRLEKQDADFKAYLMYSRKEIKENRNNEK